MGKMVVHNHFKEADIKKREKEILKIIIKMLEKDNQQIKETEGSNG
jgi:hypothetical protein